MLCTYNAKILFKMSTGNIPSTSSSSSSSSSGGPCGACKFLRRKCVADCIFAPYFSSDQGASHFAAVHKVFGASNVTKLLLHIPVNKRLDAVVTICYEAQARIRDPVFGCVAHIFALQQQVTSLQTELSYLQAHLATLEMATPPPPPPPPPHVVVPPAIFSTADLPTATCMGITYDLSSLFDPSMQPSSWTMHTRQFSGGTVAATPTDLSPTQEAVQLNDDRLQEHD